MDEYMIILRLIHIFAGIVWVGSAWFMTFVLNPAARHIGHEGEGFMRSFMRRSKVATVMGVSALLTTVAGLLLYYRVSDHFHSDWMSTAAGAVLTVGSLAGLAEFIIGGAVISPTAAQLGKLGGEIERAGGPPSPEQLTRVQALQARLGRVEIVSTVLLVVAVAGMSSARYF